MNDYTKGHYVFENSEGERRTFHFDGDSCEIIAQVPSREKPGIAISKTMVYMASHDKGPETPVRTKVHQKRMGPPVSSLTQQITSFKKKGDIVLKTPENSHTLEEQIYPSGGIKTKEQLLGANIEKSDRVLIHKTKHTGHEIALHKYKRKPFLSVLETTAAIIVFDKIIDELSVFKYMLPNSSMGVLNTRYRSLEERFGKEVRPIYPASATPIERGMLKLQTDRAYVEGVLWKTTRELQVKNTYTSLFSPVEDFCRMQKDVQTLVEAWPVLRHDLRVKQAQLRQVQTELQQQVAARTMHTVELEEQIGTTMVLQATRKRYVERWEAARFEQMVMKRKREERSLNTALRSTAKQLKAEMLAISMAKQTMAGESKVMTRKTLHWEWRRNVEVDKLINSSMNTQLALNVAQSHVQALKEQLQRRKVSLEAWYVRKNEAMRLNTAASKLQRRWRAHCYRRAVLAALLLMRFCLDGLKQMREEAQFEAEEAKKIPAKTRKKHQEQRDLRKKVLLLKVLSCFQALLSDFAAQKKLREEARRHVKGKDKGKDKRKSLGKARGSSR